MFAWCKRRQPPKSSASSWLRLTLLTTSTFLRPSFRQFSTTTTTAHALDPALLERAAVVRKQVGGFPSHADLYFPSAFPVTQNDYGDDTKKSYHMRGFCNWILPNRIMVGQYPGQVPEPSGPSAEEVRAHLQSMTSDAGVNLFCSLQSELPPQSDYKSWEAKGGEVYLEDDYWRQQFPNPFTHYAPIVESLFVTPASASSSFSCQFWHSPIEDLSVPNSSSLQELLLKLLVFLEGDDNHTNNNDQDTNNNNNNCIYLHCWGGRGRAGLVSACLVSLLYPEVDALPILDLVQAGYDSRAGADRMPRALSKSPQTESQRSFVRSFVRERQKAARSNQQRQ